MSNGPGNEGRGNRFPLRKVSPVNRKMSMSPVVCALLGFLLLGLLAPGGGMSPMMDADALQKIATVTLPDPNVKVTVEPGTHGVGSVNGIIDVTTTGLGEKVQVVTLSLQGSSSMGWPVTISPSSITVKPDSSGKVQAPFTASVTVPPKTSYKTMDTVTITGRAVAFPGVLSTQIEPSTFTVYVKQFYRFTLAADKPYKEITPGDQSAFTFHIKNDGNGDDKYRLEVPDQARLAEKGWVLSLQQYEVEVEEGKEASLVVTVNTPQEWHLWMNEPTQFAVRVYSEQAQSVGEQSPPKDYYLTIRQRGFSTPGFEPVLMLLAFAVGIPMAAVGSRSRRGVLFRRR